MFDSTAHCGLHCVCLVSDCASIVYVSPIYLVRFIFSLFLIKLFKSLYISYSNDLIFSEMFCFFLRFIS